MPLYENAVGQLYTIRTEYFDGTVMAFRCDENGNYIRQNPERIEADELILSVQSKHN